MVLCVYLDHKLSILDTDQTKEINAGKIGYGTFVCSALCIVGAGTTR
jgi:hypothetical protein